MFVINIAVVDQPTEMNGVPSAQMVNHLRYVCCCTL